MSRLGVAVVLGNRVRVGMILYLTLPLPKAMKNARPGDQTFGVYAIVRRVEPAIGGRRVAGLEFIGQHPPSAFLLNPGSVFRIPEWTGPDRRREERRELSTPVRIEYLNDSGVSIASSEGQTENVSRGGTRVRVKTVPPEFELVRIITLDNRFESTAVVRNRYRGGDGEERLCLKFIERKWEV